MKDNTSAEDQRKFGSSLHAAFEDFGFFSEAKKVASQEMERYEPCYIVVENSQLARNKSFVDRKLIPLSHDVFLDHLLPLLLRVYWYMRSL